MQSENSFLNAKKQPFKQLFWSFDLRFRFAFRNSFFKETFYLALNQKKLDLTFFRKVSYKKTSRGDDKMAILSSFDHNHKNTRFGAKITCQTTNLSSYTELSNLSPLLSRSCQRAPLCSFFSKNSHVITSTNPKLSKVLYQALRSTVLYFYIYHLMYF